MGLEPGKPTNVRVPPPKKPRQVLTIPTPDQADRARGVDAGSAYQRQARNPPTPDQADRERTPVQRQRDQRTVTINVANARRAYLQQRHAGSLARAIGNLVTTGSPSGHVTYVRKDYRPMFERDRQQQAARLAPVLSILNQTARPIHAIAGAADAAITHKPVGPAALRGLENKSNTTFSDVLGHAGVHNGLVRGVGGFVLDVGLDPTTYISLGTASVGREAAESAARKATAKALKEGASKRVADRAGRAAARDALDKATNKGLTVGAFGRRTSGRATAAVSRTLHLPQAGETARGSLGGRLVRHVSPSTRPAGVTQPQFDRVRAAIVRGRAIASTGEKRARNRAQAVARALKGGNVHPQITDALESRSLTGLKPNEQVVVKALAHDYNEMYDAEHAAGLIGSKMKDFGYSPRRPLSDLESPRARRRPGGANLASSKMRTERRMYKEFRGTKDDVYSENAPLAYYMRARDSAVKLGRKEVIDALHGEGKRFIPGMEVPAGHEVYKFSPRQMPTVVEGKELGSIMRGGAPPGLNEYRILPKALVSVAEQSVPKRLEGLEDIGSLWDRHVQGVVKTILTVPNPQYHLTNLYGDLFNAYLGSNVPALARNLGISARALVYKARREAAAKTLAKQVSPRTGSTVINGARVGLDKLIKEAEDHGAIAQGFIGRDLAEVLDAQGKEAAEKLGQGHVTRHLPRPAQRAAASRVGARVLHPIDTIRDLSQYREDAVRLATYLGARKRGLEPDAASKFVAQHHFDYGDLSQFEKSVLRRVLPFYTFTARNTPLQVRTLFTKPGKYANLEKAREEALKASGVPQGYEQNLQYYEQQGIPIPIPGTKDLLYPKLPATDLGRLTIKDQANYLMAMLTPLIKSPVELTQNYSFFLRKPIDELANVKGPNGETLDTLKPAPPLLLKALAAVPGGGGKKIAQALHMKPYVDKKTGKIVMGWPAKIDYVWRQTPETNFASQLAQQIPNTRGQSTRQVAIGYATGLKMVPYSPPNVAQQRAGQAYDYYQGLAKKMRNEGSAYDKAGNRTPAYQAVLNRGNAALKALVPPKVKASNLSPAAAALAAAEQSSRSSGSNFSPGAQALINAAKGR